MLRRLQMTFLPAMLIVLSANPLWSSEKDSCFPLALDLDMSTVYLLGVERTPREELEAEAPGAPDGLTFFALVVKKAEAQGSFTFTETRDFLIEGSSYRSRTETQFGRAFEPVTVLDEISDFFAARPHLPRPVLRDTFKVGCQEALALVVVIPGSEIPESARIDVTFKVGWGKEVEPFSFEVTSPP